MGQGAHACVQAQKLEESFGCPLHPSQPIFLETEILPEPGESQFLR